MAGASSAIAQRCVRRQARHPLQKRISFSLSVTFSTLLPASAAPRANASASASELLFARRLDDITKTVFIPLLFVSVRHPPAAA